MQELKKVDVFSVAKLALLFGAVVGILQVLVLQIASRFASSAIPAELASIPLGLSSSLFVIFSAAIGYFLGGLITALFYNLFAKWIGGIRVDLQEAKLKKK